MKILMMTNTYAPMVGGIEESIRSFTQEFERLGHDVVIVAPEAEGVPPDEVGVIRLRAIQNVNNSDFSIALPMSGLLPELLKTFTPDIIHCHHPFWIGDIALRLSRKYRIPLVFTYHTMFEQHMHYLPIQNEATKRFIIELFSGFANLATQVIVPSESVRDILLKRDVTAPMAVVPTGVDLEKFSNGEACIMRQRLGISSDVVVIGHVGRLALEKNIEFLSRSVAAYLKTDVKAHFLVVGAGSLKDLIRKIFDEQGLSDRLHLTGILKGQDLVDCYHAMNLFAFASLSETQGIVLVEAMAAGLPVVAVDASGVREVVKDGYNGRLIFAENQEHYREALAWCLQQPVDDFDQMKENARLTTKEFAVRLCAQKMLDVYQHVAAQEYVSSDFKRHAWSALAGQLTNEWDMFKNMMHSGSVAIINSGKILEPVKVKTKTSFLRIHRLLSLSEWSAKLLHLTKIDEAETEPGIILIQIDGFSRSQFKKALANNEMPFLKGLYAKEFYELYSQYPGLPSSTPSVQGEIFYGVKQIVPAFAFLDHDGAKIFRMYDSDAVIEIEKRLAAQGQGLLEGGSSYSNIYSGGAGETHFCATSLGWAKIWKDVNPLSFVLLAVTHFPSFVRMTVLTVWEIVLGMVEFGRGILNGENFTKELKFISLRALICVLLRELVVIGTKIDMVRGLPIILLNLLGYDEMSHNHGPSSKLAHWSLKGIDRAIENIYSAAVHSPHRNYDVWIYSDHGQEDTVSYEIKYGRSIQEAVSEIYKLFNEANEVFKYDSHSEQLQRVRFLGLSFVEKFFSATRSIESDFLSKNLVVTAIGPTGNIYLPRKMENDERHRFARKLVDTAKIPVLMSPREDGHVSVWNEDGEFVLPRDASVILGGDHPFLEEVTKDLVRLCHHPDGGDFTFMGYRPGKERMTFPVERGSHAGPGPEETEGFALLPSDIIPRQRQRAYITPMDIRCAAMRFLKRPIPKDNLQLREFSYSPKLKKIPDNIRVMTYNVHSCVGMDGKTAPERIARLIGRHKPDIVALQELDRGRKRTGIVDQPHLIAKELEMLYHFHPSIVDDDERYGNAILSRFPMELIRAGRLPGLDSKSKNEPRGVIWAVIDIAGIKINLFNTHLGLYPRERMHQVSALLGKEWITHPACQGPVILCGDFNALPHSQVCRSIKKVLADAQGGLENHKPKATWFGFYPVGRIDHIFVGEQIQVTRAKVSRTDLSKIASDHLPLILDIKLKQSSEAIRSRAVENSEIVPKYN